MADEFAGGVAGVRLGERDASTHSQRSAVNVDVAVVGLNGFEVADLDLDRGSAAAAVSVAGEYQLTLRVRSVPHSVCSGVCGAMSCSYPPRVFLLASAAIASVAQNASNRTRRPRIIAVGVDSHHRQSRFGWGLGPAGAEPIIIGFDVAMTDADGRIATVLGFWTECRASGGLVVS